MRGGASSQWATPETEACHQHNNGMMQPDFDSDLYCLTRQEAATFHRAFQTQSPNSKDVTHPRPPDPIARMVVT